MAAGADYTRSFAVEQESEEGDDDDEKVEGVVGQLLPFLLPPLLSRQRQVRPPLMGHWKECLQLT